MGRSAVVGLLVALGPEACGDDSHPAVARHAAISPIISPRAHREAGNVMIQCNIIKTSVC